MKPVSYYRFVLIVKLGGKRVNELLLFYFIKIRDMLPLRIKFVNYEFTNALFINMNGVSLNP